MKRRVLMILLLLVAAGAIVNVAVAWGCANVFAEYIEFPGSYAPGTVTFHARLGPKEQGWPCHSLTTIAPQPHGWGGEAIWIGNLQLAKRPIWPGFAINTVFYAFILWLLFAGPFALRRRRRIKRGLCPKCAYDLHGSANATTCPECGATRERG